MIRSLPPAGEPLRSADVIAALKRARPEDFAAEVGAYLGAGHCFLTSSGTASLVVALRALGALSPGRQEVVLPAYTCPNVLSAVVLSRLQPVLCDLSPDGAGLDLDQLANRLGPRTLAVVGVHLLGVPTNVLEVGDLARQHGAFVVEDAAQAFGNELAVGGQAARLGTIGDVGIFSFGRGKPLSLGAGGLVVTGSAEVAGALRREVAGLAPRGWPGDFLRAALYAAFFRPGLYWLPRGLPFLHLGETIFTLDMKLEGMSGYGAALGRTLLSRFEVGRLARRRRAEELLWRLTGEGARPFGWQAPAVAYLRLPLLVEAGRRHDLLARLCRLGATCLYPLPLNEQPGTAPYLGAQAAARYPNAKKLSESLLTLPLHRYLSEADVAAAERALRGAAGAPVPEVT
jgi:perosamine synthetase